MCVYVYTLYEHFLIQKPPLSHSSQSCTNTCACTPSHTTWVQCYVDIVAEIELIFVTVAFMVLCFLFVSKTMLVIQQYFSYCEAVFAQC